MTPPCVQGGAESGWRVSVKSTVENDAYINGIGIKRTAQCLNPSASHKVAPDYSYV